MLIQGNCHKWITASAGGSLEAPAGQSLLIKGIFVRPSTNDTYLTLQVDRVTVGFWRLGGFTGNHLGYIHGADFKLNVMEYLARNGINVSIPIAEGQTFAVSRYAETGDVVVVFERYDAGDMRSDMPNGSDAKEYVFVQYMDSVAGLSASGSALLDTARSPAEFPDFPCGKVVPANHRITLLGLVGSPVCAGLSGTKGWYTTHIKMIREREVLFDEDRNGIPFDADYHSGSSPMYEAGLSMIGAGMHSSAFGLSGEGDPLLFDPPLVFESGVELGVYAVMVMFGSTPTWAANVLDIAAILKVEKV